MQSFMRRCGRPLLALGAALALPVAASAQCPSKEEMAKVLQTLSPEDKLEVRKIGPAPLKALCEVQFKGAQGVGIIYVDSEAKLVFSGSVLDIGTRTNLTRERLAELNAPVPLTAEELPKLAALTAFTLGTKGPVVYFATDPM